MTRPGRGGAVVFDLDGTLVDSATDLASAANALAIELGGRPLGRAEVVAMVGDGAAVLVQRALAAAGLDPETPGALERFLAIYDARLLDTTRLYDGIVAVLDGLDPLLHLAVLTNKPRHPAERVLDGLGVRQHFIEVVGGDGPLPRKPDPAGLTSLRLHAGGGPMVLVGDSPVDLETARRGGVPFVLAAYGFGAAAFATPPTAFVAARVADLPAAIDAALADAATPIT
ncbi:MAG: HAD family hydrolase [Vicinamibacterales bacterium]